MKLSATQVHQYTVNVYIVQFLWFFFTCGIKNIKKPWESDSWEEVSAYHVPHLWCGFPVETVDTILALLARTDHTP